MYKGTLVVPDRGSGGRQRGLEGNENFADRDLEEKWPKFFLVCSWPHTPNPWGHVELVQKTWFGTMMSTDVTEDDMDLARTEEADLDPPECSGIAEVKKCARRLSLCLIGGARGGKGGWEGTKTSLIVI